MKITFLGNFGIDYCSEVHYKKTLEAMGHTVMPYQENRVTAEQVRVDALSSDMFFWVHTHGWQTPGIEGLLKELKANGIPSVGYHLDLWRGLARQVALDTDIYWNIEYFFTCDKLFVTDLEKRGIKAYYLPAGVFAKECYLAEPDRVRYPHDIIFTGSKDYHPEWPYRVKLIDWLAETYGDRFKLYGREPGIDYKQIRGHDLNVLYASAKVVIGDTLCQGFDYPYYYSDRLFEVTGRGGCLVFPYIKGIEDNFLIGKEISTYNFNDFDGLKRVIDDLLADDVERTAIRLRGHGRTKKDHTYTNRLQYILDTISEAHQDN